MSDEPGGRTTPAKQTYLGVRPGGRSARVRSAVLEAAAAELIEHGYAALSLPQVAERAGVALTTVHRRWDGKTGLVVDVLRELTQGMVPDPAGATLRDDLLALATSVTTMLRTPMVTALLRAAFVLPDDQLADIREAFWGSRIAVAQAIADRAAARGEVPPGTDGWALVEPVQAQLWMRLLITGLPVDDAFLTRVVDRALISGQTP